MGNFSCIMPFNKKILQKQRELRFLHSQSKKRININNSLLQNYCNTNQREEMLKCIDLGANDFNSLLIHATRTRNVNGINFAIEYGANDFNAQLLESARLNYKEGVHISIQNGADKFQEAAYLAILNASDNELIAFLLSEYGESININ